MNRSFELRPYIGAGSVEFGMDRDQVAQQIGPPASVTTTRGGDIEEYREGIKLHYSKSEQRMREVVLMKPSMAVYQGVDLLRTEDPLAFLRGHDPQPYEYVGTVLYLALGIAVTGFAEKDDPDSAIGVFERGRWDDLRDRLRPWSAQAAK